MKSRGIIFRSDMVRAIREGRKTQTRRVMKPQPTRSVNAWTDDSEPGEIVVFQGVPCRLSESKGRDKRALGELTPTAIRCPYGVPGDELWVRETFGVVRSLGADWDHDSHEYVYRADPASAYQWDGASSQGFRWQPSIFMPREASRLTLVVRSVRVKRLSAITDEDAVAEGFAGHESANVDGAVLAVEPAEQYLADFRAMHKLPADADPWLWVVTFGVKP